ncbi:DNA sulfur modification protein DndB [Solwaraspora sp. WMMD1047]|uniref:DNA sulfur modification protein DndB n=1 Tax=Solwaraspora sp. WMMD1047 TaxID=3016102 RepID=UPI002417F77F|nr:DNA sulfur modification protein DndB [Solwaraspora sp. WMMD1047]MDG4829333.1 DNA sulfur modification protein DndB [Solwaraspora sp. WMMD1047]
MSMLMPLPTAAVEGIQLTVTPFRPDAVIGTIALPALLQLVPSPKREEDKRAMKVSSGAVRRHAEIRSLVQRTLKSSQKGRNVAGYAHYIAAGINGDFGSGWSTPPITLWLADDPGAVSDELVPGSGICRITLLAGSPVVAIDGETQVTALHELYDDPEQYGTTYQKLNVVRLPFELYWGLSVEDARQIFYDRNVEGVAVDKNLAMSMDQRDLGTQLAHRIAEAVKVEHDGRIIPLAKLVQARKRQLTRTDPELITLSALRVLVIATIFGRRGLGLSSTTVRSGDLPETVGAERIERRVVPLLSSLLTQLYPQLAARTAAAAPAVLAGIGIAAHQATGWAVGGAELTDTDLLDLLHEIRWEKEARYWDGVAASANARGVLNFGGGAKDSGGRVADAILYPDTESGRKIRGR